MDAMTLALVNQRTEEALAKRVEVAVTRRARRKGLLGRIGLEPSSALIIAPCFSIHTMFMRFDIDAVFVDDDGRAVKSGAWPDAMADRRRSDRRTPWSNSRRGACATRQVNVGDRLYLLEPGGKRVGLSVDDLRERYTVLNRRKKPDAVLEPDKQYAVVLLNEEQLSQIMRKPGMRPVNRG